MSVSGESPDYQVDLDLNVQGKWLEIWEVQGEWENEVMSQSHSCHG